MTTFHDQLMQFSIPQREDIAHGASLSLGYIHKHMYVSGGAPKFHFHNAVGLDAASKGVIPFLQHTEGDIDWDFVRRRLNNAKRKGLI